MITTWRHSETLVINKIEKIKFLLFNMRRIYETQKSALLSYPLDVSIKESLAGIISEIDSKLHVNPKITIYGREAIQHRSIAFFSEESIGYRCFGKGCYIITSGLYFPKYLIIQRWDIHYG